MSDVETFMQIIYIKHQKSTILSKNLCKTVIYQTIIPDIRVHTHEPRINIIKKTPPKGGRINNKTTVTAAVPKQNQTPCFFFDLSVLKPPNLLPGHIL